MITLNVLVQVMLKPLLVIFQPLVTDIYYFASWSVFYADNVKLALGQVNQASRSSFGPVEHDVPVVSGAAVVQALAEELDISERVDLEVNVPLDRLLQLYGAATVGLHTMKNEHFGIGEPAPEAAAVGAVHFHKFVKMYRPWSSQPGPLALMDVILYLVGDNCFNLE